MNWNDFAKYYDWEFQQICTRQIKDIVLWKRFAERFGGPILEICCGSGRITLPLAKEGFEIFALDYSEKLLEILINNISETDDIKIVKSDMRSFHINKHFSFAFISYASFQQLLTLKDQVDCLTNIYNHLSSNGILAFDITPSLCEGEDFNKETLQYSLLYPQNSSEVKLYSAYQIDRLNCIKHYYDRYEEIDINGCIKTFKHDISLKEITPDYMKILLEKCGFELIEIYGGFNGEELNKNSSNAIYVAQKKSNK